MAYAARPKQGNTVKQSGQFSRSGTTPGFSRSDTTPPPPSLEDDKGFRWCDPTNEGHCHRCGRPGHIAAFCMYSMPRDIREWILARPPRSSYSSSPSTNPKHQSEQLLSSTLINKNMYTSSPPSSPSSSPPRFILQI